jgi:hypothetical protein
MAHPMLSYLIVPCQYPLQDNFPRPRQDDMPRANQRASRKRFAPLLQGVTIRRLLLLIIITAGLAFGSLTLAATPALAATCSGC